MSADLMVSRAARVLWDGGAEQCGVDAGDSWKVYGSEYIADAQAMLDEVGVTDLLAALRRCAQRILADEGINSPIYQQAAAAISKAEGKA